MESIFVASSLTKMEVRRRFLSSTLQVRGPGEFAIVGVIEKIEKLKSLKVKS
jgi:hypothetical protein